MKNIVTNHLQSQSAEWICSSDFSGLAAGVVSAVAVDSGDETEVRSRNSDCCFTAHAGLGLNGSQPHHTQNLEGHSGTSAVDPRQYTGSIKPNMNNKNPSNEGVASVANITRKSVFSFKTRPVIAPKGRHNALWGGVVNEVGDDFNRAVATVELAAKDPKGHSFVLAEGYNLNGLGAKAFLQDYNAWTGAGLTEDDLYDSFNGEKDKGKPLVVEVDHRKKGKHWEAYIKAFHPAETTEPAAVS